MLKRNIRQRKEYLFKKTEEIKSKQIFAKKTQLQSQLDNNNNNNNIPLSSENESLLTQMQYDDITTRLPYNIADDEYIDNKNREPKILVTTSRSPSQRLTQMLKEMRLIIPNSVRVNRGNIVIKDIVKACQENEYSDLIILHENRGNPDGMIISHMPFGPTIYFGLYNVVLRHDIEVEIDKVSEAYPHLIFDGFSTRLGERVCEIIKAVFPVPKAESKRVITFYNKGDYVSFRHHVYEKRGDGDKQEIILEEVGPRFEMRPYQILLGTVDQPDSNKEWVLRPFMNTAKNKNNL